MSFTLYSHLWLVACGCEPSVIFVRTRATRSLPVKLAVGCTFQVLSNLVRTLKKKKKKKCWSGHAHKVIYSTDGVIFKVNICINPGVGFRQVG